MISPLPLGEGQGVRAFPIRNDMVSNTFNGSNLNVRAEAVGFVCNHRANAVYGGFVNRGRFGFNQSFKQGFRFHRSGLEREVENENDHTHHCTINREDIK